MRWRRCSAVQGVIGVLLVTGLLGIPVAQATVVPPGPVSGVWDIAGSPYQVEGDILAECEGWWKKHVIGRVPPEPDGSASFKRYLRDRYSKTRGEWLEPSDEMRELIEGLRKVECLSRAVDKAFRSSLSAPTAARRRSLSSPLSANGSQAGPSGTLTPNSLTNSLLHLRATQYPCWMSAEISRSEK